MWTDIITWVSDQWVELVATGGVTVASIKWFIVDRITLAKEQLRVADFSGKVREVGEDVRAVSKVLYEKFEDFQSKLETYEGKVSSLAEENTVLSNLLVQTLTVANIPLEAKQNFYESLMTLDKVNDVAKETLRIAIQKQVDAQQSVTQKTEDTSKKLSEV